MRILFVNHNSADSNSAYHIFGFARGLSARGHEVRIAVSDSIHENQFEFRDGCTVATRSTVLKQGAGFADGRIADVVHVWTPREPLRLFAEQYFKTWKARSLVIHLEDNEEAIYRRFTGHRMEDAGGLISEWNNVLIHPAHYRRFLKSAQGVTMVHRCISELVPAGMEALEIVPVIDFDFFAPPYSEAALREELGLNRHTQVIAYNGNDHAASSADTHMLYEAVDLLINQGRDVALVRTGQIMPHYYQGLSFRPGPRCLELGYIDRGRIPAVLELASVFVQPGDADAFNSFRLPSKIPEYLAVGKPLITCPGNIGVELAEHGGALVLPHMTPRTIADAIAYLLDHTEEATAMGKRGQLFARRRFAGDSIIAALEAFYERCVGRAPAPNGSLLVQPSGV